MNIKNNKGFTLIELMITVAIVGILAAVAVPAYQDYVIRSQVAEGFSLLSGSKVPVTEYYQNHGEYPANGAAMGLVPTSGKYVVENRIDYQGTLIARFGNDSNENLKDKQLSFYPTENESGNLEWTCESDVNKKYLPSGANCGFIVIAVSSNGTLTYLLDGKVHRRGAPAAIYKNGDQRWYINGQLHREDGPAYERITGQKEWYINGQRHRTDGPALILPNGTKQYFVNGTEMTEQEFNAQYPQIS